MVILLSFGDAGNRCGILLKKICAQRGTAARLTGAAQSEAR
jgi:hypothetical protein